jgi:hypothetical protein
VYSSNTGFFHRASAGQRHCHVLVVAVRVELPDAARR